MSYTPRKTPFPNDYIYKCFVFNRNSKRKYTEIFYKIAEIIERNWKKCPIFIHCDYGFQLSPSALIAYYIIKKKKRYN